MLFFEPTNIRAKTLYGCARKYRVQWASWPFTTQVLSAVLIRAVLSMAVARISVDLTNTERSLILAILAFTCTGLTKRVDYIDPQVSCHCFPGRTPLHSDATRCSSQSTNCSNTEFECSNGFCIPFHFTWDGVAECPDFSDELPTFCTFRKCIPGFFQCANNR